MPGASAVTAALAVSGLPADRFVFEGFLPRKPGQRSRRLGALSEEPRTVVFFAAPSRVADDLTAIAAAFGRDRRVAVARELTKVHEEVFRGTATEAARRWTKEIAPRGEFTLVVEELQRRLEASRNSCQKLVWPSRPGAGCPQL